ncbi:MAG: DUF937 domain-containing protein [Bacteriovorax sp.]|jgi:hypothetical protein
MAVHESLHSVSQDFFTPEIVQKISNVCGLSADKTKVALMSVIPEFISGIFDKGATPEGASNLVNLLKIHKFESVVSPDEKKLQEGNEVVNNIYGEELNNTVYRLSSSTGLSSLAIQKILGLVAPVVLGSIGSKIKNEHLTPSGLMTFFNQQKKIFAGFSPETSEYYSLTGADPEKDFHKNFGSEIPWKKIILAFIIFAVIWFWWQALQLRSPMTDVEPTKQIIQ